MTYLNNLCQVYENNKHLVGKEVVGCRCLLPRYHNFQNAHIDVTIDINGNFLRAKKFVEEGAKKETKEIIIPVTSKSASRTSAGCPHGIFDNLRYVAGDFNDYADFGADEKKEKAKRETVKKNNETYMEQLKEFRDKSKNKKIAALYTYLEKKTLLKDIKKVVNGKITAACSLFIAFSVEVENEPQSKLYLDKEIRRQWEEFCLAEEDDTDSSYCYILGTEKPIIKTHSKGILKGCNDGKIISANDSVNFTFRGRFRDETEALSISIEASERAHSALKWLIDKQGFFIGTENCILFYSSNGREVKNEFDENENEEFLKRLNVFETSWNDEALYCSENTMEGYANLLKERFLGYREDTKDEKICCLVLSSTGKGRLSVVYNREFLNNDYFGLLEKWYGSMSYEKAYVKGQKFDSKLSIQTPSPTQILFACYGGDITTKLKNLEYRRLLECILEGKSVPKDLVQRAFLRLVNKSSFFENYKKDVKDTKKITNAKIGAIWLDAVRTFLAMYKNISKEEVKMALDESRCSRSYLYGRLLAVAEVAEHQSLEEQAAGPNGDIRQTNASRYFNQLASKPSSTWKTIRLSLENYISRLKYDNGGRRYRYMISEICDKFEIKDFVNNKPLNCEFLLGYEHQIKYIYTKREETEEKTEEIIEE